MALYGMANGKEKKIKIFHRIFILNPCKKYDQNKIKEIKS
jgi:hypothetical protein